MALEQVTAWVMLAALTAYVLLGGADFGAGVWDLLARGARKDEQRALIERAIGPIWEANHVWLILVIVLLFTCFPPAFAALATALHVPLTLVLIGIVLRGSAFTFRAYSGGEAARREREHGAGASRENGERSPNAYPTSVWGVVFSVASIVTPMLLGVTLGAAASGDLLWDERGVYVSGFFRPWLRPFPWAVGGFALAIFAYLAAVYLCVEAVEEVHQSATRPGSNPNRAESAPVVEDFRRRALWAAGAVGVMAGVTWVLAIDGAELLSRELAGSWWTWPLQIATGLAAVGAIGALWTRRYVTARALAVGQVALIVLGYGTALFPYLIVPQVTVEGASAPARTHRLVLGALAVGGLVLIPSLVHLMRVFKGRRVFAVVDESGGAGGTEGE